MSDRAVKTSAFLPVSNGLMVDGLWFRTLLMSSSDRITEYLRYGQSVSTGTYLFNPADAAELVGWVEWDDEDYLPYLDWPECDLDA